MTHSLFSRIAAAPIRVVATAVSVGKMGMDFACGERDVEAEEGFLDEVADTVEKGVDKVVRG